MHTCTACHLLLGHIDKHTLHKKVPNHIPKENVSHLKVHKSLIMHECHILIAIKL